MGHNSVSVLLPNSGRRWRWAHIQGETPRVLYEGDRFLLRVGLLLVVARVPEVRGPPRVRPVRRVVHNAMYRGQHAVHGFGPPRYGQRYGESAQKWQLCKCTHSLFIISSRTSLNRAPKIYPPFEFVGRSDYSTENYLCKVVYKRHIYWTFF